MTTSRGPNLDWYEMYQTIGRRGEISADMIEMSSIWSRFGKEKKRERKKYCLISARYRAIFMSPISRVHHFFYPWLQVKYIVIVFFIDWALRPTHNICALSQVQAWPTYNWSLSAQKLESLKNQGTYKRAWRGIEPAHVQPLYFPKLNVGLPTSRVCIHNPVWPCSLISLFLVWVWLNGIIIYCI